jgi:hypothetical protein
MEVTNITGKHFMEAFPASHRGISNEYLAAAIGLDVGSGFSVECPGKHYYQPNGNRYACGIQNRIRRYGRTHGYDFHTSHDGDNLLVFHAPPNFDLSFPIDVVYKNVEVMP